ncbi:MAG: hypothetical protein GAK30_01715 [Paracidovorax wautersii]|uniref:Uncharacterized protein n=1 Tax=Paracidovorax wautersii TaxID=1177982 RepID=A0A7V8JQU2_9BURK|nr:MAG: hypothetical protein GAK30_01715 [Paracidovorax wautersii]
MLDAEISPTGRLSSSPTTVARTAICSVSLMPSHSSSILPISGGNIIPRKRAPCDQPEARRSADTPSVASVQTA